MFEILSRFKKRIDKTIKLRQNYQLILLFIKVFPLNGINYFLFLLSPKLARNRLNKIAAGTEGNDSKTGSEDTKLLR